MKKWAIIDRCEHEEFLTVCMNKGSAINLANHVWNHELSNSDKKSRVSFVVGLVNVELDDNEEYQYFEDEHGNIDADIYETAKVYK